MAFPDIPDPDVADKITRESRYDVQISLSDLFFINPKK
tara:strand:+ start:332 stop:445 length:114 start_codon:yes stop_codon:yes gene_type:complete